MERRKMIMRNKLGTICMGLGAVLVLAALSLFLWNQQEAKRAGESAQEILPEVIEHIEAADDYPDPYNTDMTVAEIDGYGYIGYLSIPALGLELPVMSEWDYPRLKIAPCRYAGATKTDDLVIAAHNYARHFGTLSQLAAGDEVYFLDMDGVLSCYEVVEVITLAPTDVEEMTSGDYALTMFTCTYGGKSRVTVRCEREDVQTTIHQDGENF